MAKPQAVATATPQEFAASAMPQLVQLDASTSFDPDGFAITAYSWTLLYAPPGSAAVLSSAAIVNPTFTADVVGSYLFFLVVTSSDPSEGISEVVMRNAPNSAVLSVTAETLNNDWHIPASGERNWADHFHEIITEIDADLLPLSNTHSRTDSLTGRHTFNDSRVAGAPFLTSDYLASFSNKNATGHTGENERGAIQLDMEQANTPGEASYANEMTDGDGFAVLTGGPWRGLTMLSPAPTGSEVPTMLQAGKAGAEITDFQLLRAYWDESGSNDLQLWMLEQTSGHRSYAILEEEADVDNAGNTTRYLRFAPGHATPGSVEDQRMRLERMRLQLRREILVELNDPATADYDKDWRIRLWRIGEAAADQPEFGWNEDNKSWYVKGVDNSDNLVHSTGTTEKTRIEHGQLVVTNNTGGTTSVIEAWVPYDRAFASIPNTIGSLLGADPNMEEKVGAVYVYPRAGNTLTQLKVQVNAQVGQTFADGDNVTVSWMAIGNDTD